MKTEFNAIRDPHWYKDAVIYELHVKSFCDSNGDGIGDFPGLTGKLPYLQSLGVTALWLLPFYPSPLRDDGYDIADYYGINQDYGDMGDFKEFLKEAHRLGMRVITELVVNHTSDQHPWFKRARLAPPGSAARNYYVWSDTPEKYKDARIIFKDFETSNWTWDSEAKAYYWHRFYHHQPDLNFANPHVQTGLLKVVDLWLGLGVDGLRLDAVPYLFEAEGTNCENLPQTHEFLKKLRAHVDSKFQDRMLLCEANQWPEDAASYFGAGDECNMAFHFPVMPRLFMSLWMEDSFPVTDILDQTPQIPDACQWAVFLRNHDELTLEMVTDEERDYMYKVYARDAKARINLGIRRRLAPLLGNSRRKIELMNILLFSLPGTPVLYYGDEIGMGDNFYLGDRNGVRTPMQWSPDRNAGFSRVNPQRLFLPVVSDPEYHYAAVNVESQEGNLSSLLWWMKRVIAMRANYKCFGRGTFEAVRSDNPKVLAFVRRHGEELVLVVANLSRFSQAAALDLSRYAGHTPVDVFSGNEFPAIGEKPYLMTPGFHNYYWFQLRKTDTGTGPQADQPPPELKFEGTDWEALLDGGGAARLGPALEAYARRCRCFTRGAASPRTIRLAEHFHLPSGGRLAVLEARHSQGWIERYLLPLRFVTGEAAAKAAAKWPQAVVAALEFPGEKGVLLDAALDPLFHADLLSIFIGKKKIRSGQGELWANTLPSFRKALESAPMPGESRVLKADANGITIVYGAHFLLRFGRRLEEGISPDLELGARLGRDAAGPGVPQVYGGLNLNRDGRFHGTLGVLRAFVPNQGDAWALMVDEVFKYYEAAQSAPAGTVPPAYPVELAPVEMADIPQQLVQLAGAVPFEAAAMLGRRLGEVHAALAAGAAAPEFSPEPFTRLYQRSIYQSVSGGIKKSFLALAKQLRDAPPPEAEGLRELHQALPKLLDLLNCLIQKKFSATKIRIHGNCSLTQALFTGKDFVIKDFEGDLGKPTGERRIKRSPLRDAASMTLSFYYAAHAPFLLPGGLARKELPALDAWLRPWFHYAAGSFLRGYFGAVRQAALLPQPQEDALALLKVYAAEKAALALAGELQARPDWALVPAKFLRAITDAHAPRQEAAQ
ncbi:MAG: maltose alpha-D-glucosyltransferase [Elusimicrobia bacterium HGW-Elusimicrobia-3]|nr:MAG: maltose alpha-D-glucosyltransferase [Elusimicrobia bacterium HGW-Elusimicrobia-3]